MMVNPFLLMADTSPHIIPHILHENTVLSLSSTLLPHPHAPSHQTTEPSVDCGGHCGGQERNGEMVLAIPPEGFLEMAMRSPRAEAAGDLCHTAGRHAPLPPLAWPNS